LPLTKRDVTRESANDIKSGKDSAISGGITINTSSLSENLIENNIMRKAAEAVEDDKVCIVRESLGSSKTVETAEISRLNVNKINDSEKNPRDLILALKYDLVKKIEMYRNKAKLIVFNTSRVMP
jgi:hypothetical protein